MATLTVFFLVGTQTVFIAAPAGYRGDCVFFRTSLYLRFLYLHLSFTA